MHQLQALHVARPTHAPVPLWVAGTLVVHRIVVDRMAYFDKMLRAAALCHTMTFGVVDERDLLETGDISDRISNL